MASCTKSGGKQSGVENASGQVVKYEIKINGMTCTGCEQTIQNSVTGISGVKSIVANHSLGSAVVEFESAKTDTTEIKNKINSTGYVAVNFKEIGKN
jgi:copper chaperone CopZ